MEQAEVKMQDRKVNFFREGYIGLPCPDYQLDLGIYLSSHPRSLRGSLGHM